MNTLGDEIPSSPKHLHFMRKIFRHLFVSNNLGDEISFLTQSLSFCEKNFSSPIGFKFLVSTDGTY